MKDQRLAERLEHEQHLQRSRYAERPTIYVVVPPGAEYYFQWVAVGAEEEGVPCRQVDADGVEPLAQAFVAAQSSRLGVGVAVGRGHTVLHEAHMPQTHPVQLLPLASDGRRVCRLTGSNAGRLVKRMPLRLEDSLNA